MIQLFLEQYTAIKLTDFFSVIIIFIISLLHVCLFTLSCLFNYLFLFHSSAAPFYTFVAFCRSGGAVQHEVKELVRNKSCNNLFGRFSLCLGSDKLTCTAAEVYFSLDVT